MRCRLHLPRDLLRCRARETNRDAYSNFAGHRRRQNRTAAAALDGLIEFPDLARELGERGRTRALRNFSADRILPSDEALYRRVVVGR